MNGLERIERQIEAVPGFAAQIDELFGVALANGALGGKACGAGGGGCLVFYAQPDCEHTVRGELEQAGASIIDFNFDFHGLRTW